MSNKNSSQTNENLKKSRIIFAGTPDFSVPTLMNLISDDFFDIIAVITRPDRKIGRKQVLTPPPVKTLALKHNLPVYQPEKISQLKEKIKALKPDIIVVIAYSQIIPEEILKIPKFGFINVHGSLLPKYRGAACVQAPIIAGDKQTGITIMKMDKGLDTGPILAQESIPIEAGDTGGSLYKKLAKLGALTLVPTLKKYLSGDIMPKPQSEKDVSYVKKLRKQDGHISWQNPAHKIERFVRAMMPWPGAFTYLDDGKQNDKIVLKIILVEHEPLKVNDHEIGEIFCHENKLAIQCASDALIIKKLQLPGKKEITAEDFIRGHSNLIGKILK